jgi:hypothetical protein
MHSLHNEQGQDPMKNGGKAAAAKPSKPQGTTFGTSFSFPFGKK